MTHKFSKVFYIIIIIIIAIICIYILDRYFDVLKSLLQINYIMIVNTLGC